MAGDSTDTTEARAARVAGELTKAQRDCLLGAIVKPPLKNVTVGGKPFMPNYWQVVVPANHSDNSPMELDKAGLWNLPIRIGDRSYTKEYHGQILPLGLLVRKHLENER